MITLNAIGYLGQDARFQNANDENKQIFFSIAHTEQYKKDGTQMERTTWLNCYYYSNSEKLVAALTKGSCVAVVGTVSVSSYVDQSGAAKHVIYVQVMKLSIVSQNKNVSNGTAQ